MVKNEVISPKTSVSITPFPTSSHEKGVMSPSSPQLRQSRPFLSKLNTKPAVDHKHNLTLCAFPGGKVFLVLLLSMFTQ